MDTMDAQLAAIYGTGQPEAFDEADLQKTAAAELLVKLAEEQNIDLNQYSDEEIGELVGELMGKTAQEEAAPAAPPFPPKKEEKEEEKKEEEKEEEKKEKVAEADFLGRVMAHAYVQELGNIEKEAGAKSKVLGFLKGQAKNVKEGVTGWEAAGRGGGKIGLGKLERAKKLAPAAAAALAAGGGTAAAMKKKGSADGSALEEMAQQYAFEMAKQAGWIDEEGNLLHELPQQPQQEKQASALELAVHQRALEICSEVGLPIVDDE